MAGFENSDAKIVPTMLEGKVAMEVCGGALGTQFLCFPSVDAAKRFALRLYDFAESQEAPPAASATTGTDHG